MFKIIEMVHYLYYEAVGRLAFAILWQRETTGFGSSAPDMSDLRLPTAGTGSNQPIIFNI